MLTIIIPVYNEGENITSAVERIEQEVKYPYQINLIYDSDEDTTLEPAKNLNVNLVKNKYGKGVLNAIKTGLEDVQTEFAVVTMADLSDPPEVINEMIDSAIKNNASIVCASRYMEGGKQIGGPFLKKMMSKYAGLSLHYLAGIPVHDVTNSFKLYRKSFLESVKIESTGGFELGLELVVKAFKKGDIITEVPTVWTDRVAGKSNFKLIEWLPKYLKWYFRAFGGRIVKKS